MRTISYRIRKGTWGVAGDLTAEAVLSAEPPAHAEPVCGHVWQDASPVLAHPPGDRTRLRVLPEGRATAMLQWAEEEFRLEPRAVRTTFDRQADRYVYDW